MPSRSRSPKGGGVVRASGAARSGAIARVAVCGEWCLRAFWPGTVVADAVFDVGVLAVAVLEHRDVLVGLVGEYRLEAARHDRWTRAVRQGAGVSGGRSAWADLLERRGQQPSCDRRGPRSAKGPGCYVSLRSQRLVEWRSRLERR